MTEPEGVNDLLSQHKTALTTYREWDEKVKLLLRGRRAQDLTQADMLAYREAADKRDAAYDQMRHFERTLLDDIPGSSTGGFKRVDPKHKK